MDEPRDDQRGYGGTSLNRRLYRRIALAAHPGAASPSPKAQLSVSSPVRQSKQAASGGGDDQKPVSWLGKSVVLEEAHDGIAHVDVVRRAAPPAALSTGPRHTPRPPAVPTTPIAGALARKARVDAETSLVVVQPAAPKRPPAVADQHRLLLLCRDHVRAIHGVVEPDGHMAALAESAVRALQALASQVESEEPQSLAGTLGGVSSELFSWACPRLEAERLRKERLEALAVAPPPEEARLSSSTQTPEHNRRPSIQRSGAGRAYPAVSASDGFVNPLEGLPEDLLSHANSTMSMEVSAPSRPVIFGSSKPLPRREEPLDLTPGDAQCLIPLAPSSTLFRSSRAVTDAKLAPPMLTARFVTAPPPDDDHERPGQAAPDPCFRPESSLQVSAASSATKAPGASRSPKLPERAVLVAASSTGLAKTLVWACAVTPQGRTSGVKAADFEREGWTEWWHSTAETGGLDVLSWSPDSEENQLFPFATLQLLGQSLRRIPPSATPLSMEALRPPVGWSGKDARGSWWRHRPNKDMVMPGTEAASKPESLAVDLTMADMLLLTSSFGPGVGEVFDEVAQLVLQSRKALSHITDEASQAVESSGDRSSWIGDWGKACDGCRGIVVGALSCVTLLLGRHLLRFSPSNRREALGACACVLDEVDVCLKRASDAEVEALTATSDFAESTGTTRSGLTLTAPLIELAANSRAILSHVAVLSDRLEARQAAGMSLGVQVPAPGEPRFDSWLHAPVRLLAEQWARLDFQTFQRIPVEEFLAAGFDDARYKHSADAVLSLVDRFNAQALWAAAEVVGAPSPKARAAVYMRIVSLGLWLRRLRDYAGVAAIHTGLTSPPVKRLRETLCHLPPEALDQAKEIGNLVSEKMFWMRYFAALSGTPPGAAATPYLGPHTKILLMTAAPENIPDQFPTNWRLWHAYKARALYEAVSPLTELRECSYTIQRDGEVARPVHSVCALLEAAFRPHTFYFGEDASEARSRLLTISQRVEPDVSLEAVPDIDDYEQE
jgi:hypothetical protein